MEKTEPTSHKTTIKSLKTVKRVREIEKRADLEKKIDENAKFLFPERLYRIFCQKFVGKMYPQNSFRHFLDYKKVGQIKRCPLF